MIHTLTCPTGLDKNIQKLQTELFEFLCDDCVWGLKERDYECYGRVYRNKTDKGYVPEAFIGDKDYAETLLNDTVKVTSFFGVGNTDKVNATAFDAEVHLVFFVELKEDITPEQARNKVFELLRLECHGFTNVNEVTGVERVLEEYIGMSTESLIKFDQRPYCCFRFNMTNTYNLLN